MMKSYKLIIKLLETAEEIDEKEYDIIQEEGNIRCTCEWSSLHPEAYKLGDQICNHVELFLKLPQLFEEQ